MTNKVEIVVVGVNRTAQGFTSARNDAKALSGDLEKEMKRGGEGMKRQTTSALAAVGKEAAQGAAKTGFQMGSSMVESMASKVMAAKQLALPAIAAIGIGAAPILAGTISGAIVGGVGMGGVLGGVALVSDHPEVKEAGKRFTENLMGDLKRNAQPFVEPVVNALGILDKAVDRSGDSIKGIFENSAKFVEPLASSIGYMIERIAGGMNVLTERAGPVMDAFGDIFEMIGTDLGNAFEIFSRNSESSAENLRMVVGVISDLIPMTASFLQVLNELSQNPFITGPIIAMLQEHYKSTAVDTQKLAEENQNLEESYDEVSNSATVAVSSLDELNAKLREQYDPVFALMKAQEKLRKAQDDVTTATDKYGQQSPQARLALRKLAEAAVDLQGKVGAAGNSFTGRLTPAMRATLTAAGLTKSQIAGLENAFADAKAQGDRFAKNYRATVTVTYRTRGEAEASGLSVRALMEGRNYRSGGVVGAASGGARSGLTLVGEEGAELLQLPAGTHVSTAGDTRRKMRQESGGGMPGGWSGSGPYELIVRAAPSSDSPVMNEIIKSLRFEIRQANGIVQEFLGTNR